MTTTEAAKALLDYLETRHLKIDPRYMPAALSALAQVLMEVEVNHSLDAGRYERRAARRAYRNGYRESPWQTDYGEVLLRIPKLRKGTYYPDFLRGAEEALTSFVLNAYAQGVKLSQVEALLNHLRLGHLSAGDAAEVYQQLEDTVADFRQQPVDDIYTCLYLDALQFRDGQRWRCLLVAVGVLDSGEREFLAHEITSDAGDVEWTRLLRALQARGLRAVEYVVSQDYAGVRTAVDAIFPRALWQHESAFLLREHMALLNDGALVDAVSSLRVEVEESELYLPLMTMEEAMYGIEWELEWEAGWLPATSLWVVA